jgi:hypothetical protein
MNLKDLVKSAYDAIWFFSHGLLEKAIILSIIRPQTTTWNFQQRKIVNFRNSKTPIKIDVELNRIGKVLNRMI